MNAEFVSTEDYERALGAPMGTVNVRITKDAVDKRHALTETGLSTMATEILVHFGSDYKRILGMCKCARACRRLSNAGELLGMIENRNLDCCIGAVLLN